MNVLIVVLGLKVTFLTGFGLGSAELVAAGSRGVVSEDAVEAIVAIFEEYDEGIRRL